MTLLLGYQSQDQCLIATDLFEKGSDRDSNRGIEKLKRTKDEKFYMAFTGRKINPLWVTEIYNHHTKEEFLNGDLGLAGKKELKLSHPSMEDTVMYLFQPPIEMLSVDIDIPQIYFGILNGDRPTPFSYLSTDQFIALGYDTRTAIRLLHEKFDEIFLETNNSKDTILSVMEKIILEMGEKYPDYIKGLASYSIMQEKIRRESYRAI